VVIRTRATGTVSRYSTQACRHIDHELCATLAESPPDSWWTRTALWAKVLECLPSVPDTERSAMRSVRYAKSAA
jgi:hypothetical protein